MDEQIFGAAFDGQVIRRFGKFLWPHRARLAVALGGVVGFTATQLLIPLVIGTTIDRALAPGGVDSNLLALSADGTLLVYVGKSPEGGTQLYRRDLTGFDPV